MNSNYIDEYTNMFEKVLAVGYQERYSSLVIEHAISYSSYFQKIEKDNSGPAPIANDVDLLKEIYSDSNGDITNLPTFNQCLWASEAYLRIQEKTRLTFECIFLYIPLKDMYDYFPLYHEMDFTHIIKRFDELYNEQSALAILLNKYGYSLKDVSVRSGIPYSTLHSIKERARDIKKISAESIIKLAHIFNVRIETIAEMQID